MKTLVTGAEGMLGSSVCQELARRGHDVVPVGRTPRTPGTLALDVCDAEAVARTFAQTRPDAVLHLAAETDVDRCEQEPARAYRTNAAGTEHVARACRAIGARLLYMSTASVFDGRKPTPYVETDEPNPVNVYARSKLAGEFAARQLGGAHQIVRTGWMVGGYERDKKFVGKILRLLEERTELAIVTDKRGSLTFTDDLAAALADLLQTAHVGVIHVANTGVCSRFDVACSVVQLLGRRDVTIRPVTSEAFPLPAPRSDSEALESLRLAALRLPPLPSWEQALARYVQQYLDTAAKAA
jgi:dTDP-4-dehydrorhamnose reductase